MTSLPKLAILTASYNRLVCLSRLHRSLHEQNTSLDWIHVVVDDASEPVIEACQLDTTLGRLNFSRNERNVGPLVTRNRAIEKALALSVDLVAFVDDDDYVLPDFFEYVVDMWNEQRSVGWYVSRCRFAGPCNPGTEAWPDADAVYDWFDDMQLQRRFGADVMHVVSATRLAHVRFSTWGRYQREWTFLARLANEGGFFAMNRVTKVSTYSIDGITLSRRGIAPDFVTCWSYVSKPAVIVYHRPGSPLAWVALLRQLIRFPFRIAVLGLNRMVRRSDGNPGI
ncbi:MAG: glycosyltransferase family 2 protein [Tahibacter sp.]